MAEGYFNDEIEKENKHKKGKREIGLKISIQLELRKYLCDLFYTSLGIEKKQGKVSEEKVEVGVKER